jgi:hypothetical protein
MKKNEPKESGMTVDNVMEYVRRHMYMKNIIKLDSDDEKDPEKVIELMEDSKNCQQQKIIMIMTKMNKKMMVMMMMNLPMTTTIFIRKMKKMMLGRILVETTTNQGV